MVFYGWSEPVFLLIVLGSTILDWLLGKGIVGVPRGRGLRKMLVAGGVISNLGLLISVKYAAFGVQNLNALLSLGGLPPLAVPAVALPLGISFIVFEKITYLVDLYRGVALPARSLLDYCNYVFLFPKLLAGPIVKYHDIVDQLHTPSHGYEDVRDGLIRFVQGLAKKTLLADTLSPMADGAFSLSAASLDSGTAWLGLICFTLQIYFDFSGYSDMAIGLGRVLGFRLLENFHHPYLATSFTDFWRRWHISLSTWIKEYLYIPLGGNRVSTARSYVNLCICFVLSGLWHGASWNFVIWGCAHGVALVAERAFWLRWQKVLPTAFNRALTFLLIALTWVWFRCPAVSDALTYFHALGGARATVGNPIVPGHDVWTALAVGLSLILWPLCRDWTDALHRGQVDPGVSGAASPPGTRLAALAFAAVLLPASVAHMTVGSFHPFLYFRF